MIKNSFVLFLILLSETVLAQKIYHRGEISQMLDKLKITGSALYIAAHPDDENTRLIAYLANHEKVRTAYLSATRGDGGQNLIGKEIREKLGVIRTQELLAARRTDGGEQFFSRANDFGYSKHPDETFNIWNKDQVLSDFVRAIRKFRPDVLITRFDTTPGITHGHHTASAALAMEAFELSGDPKAYPDQLDELEVWQPKKLFWNTSWWFYRNTKKKMDTASMITINVGKYNPNLGKSYTEIAAESRSMHKCQGFGSAGTRGDRIEYLKQWGGEQSRSLFGGIDLTWNRVQGGDRVLKNIELAIEKFNAFNRKDAVKYLLSARKELKNIKDKSLKEQKSQEIDEAIQAIMGLYLSLSTKNQQFSPSDSINISFEAINRSDVPIKLEEILFDTWNDAISLNTNLLNNKGISNDFSYQIPKYMDYSNPYWLDKPASLGMYTVENDELLTTPENKPAISAKVVLKIDDEKLIYQIPVLYKTTDPVKGEVKQPISITPPVMVNIAAEVLVFGGNESKEVIVKVIAGKKNISPIVKLEVPSGWKVFPNKYEVSLSRKGEEKELKFTVTPPEKEASTTLSAVAILGEKNYNQSLAKIAYDHIPIQTVMMPAKVKIVKVNLKKRGNKIGYIQGAGDLIPQNMRQVGYQVDLLGKDDITLENLKKYDAVVVGIRAFNTKKWMIYKNKVLFKYVKNGGNMLVQYNTSYRLLTDEVAPYPLTISRDRVTVEEAPVRVLAPKHPVMNHPNQITQKDFEGWVQERGLYFPNKWSDEFTPIFSSNDPKETPKNGGLLIAKYGKGYYVYSGYSWFRELPAGVAGAYKIFVNLISLKDE